MTNRDLLGKVAVITGGGAGIGKAIALLFAEHGADLAIPDVDLKAAKLTSALIEEKGQRCLPIEADIADPKMVDCVFDDVLNKYGTIDILVNNAGKTHPAVSILDLDPSFIDKIFAVDYKGLYLCCRRAITEMSNRSGGVIINISSIAGIVPLPLVMYGPMKSAVNMLTRILAREWAGRNIRVNAIAPGYVLTPLMEGMIQRGERDAGKIIERTPMGLLIKPEDVAEAALFLASSKSRYITGAVMTVDGGWTSDGGWTAYPR
jgi:NAD(P)-dependent dehydrogenase (short-subunit alcohol dehydrogenase family)